MYICYGFWWKKEGYCSSLTDKEFLYYNMYFPRLLYIVKKKIYIKTTWRYTYRESIAISFIQGEMYMPLINNTKKATPLVFCNIKPLRKREHGANQMIINQVKSAFLCFNIWEVQVYYMYDNQYTTWVVH